MAHAHGVSSPRGVTASYLARGAGGSMFINGGGKPMMARGGEMASKPHNIWA